MVRRASTSKASPVHSVERNVDVDKHVRAHARIYARAGPRMAFSLPSSISLPLFFFFLFFSTWATWRRVLTPGDSCEGSSAPLVVCDSGVSFGGREKGGVRKIGAGRRKSYVSAKGSREFPAERDRLLFIPEYRNRIVAIDPPSIRKTRFSHMDSC